MTLPPIDTHRTGVQARLIPSDSNELRMCKDRIPTPGAEHLEHWYGPPGVMQFLIHEYGVLFGFNIACPSCGQLRSYMTCELDGKRHRWDLTWTRGKVETITLGGLLTSNCCGWTGSLIEGIFVCLE